MRFDERAMSCLPTRATSVTRHGQYTQVEVWANKTRFKLSFDRYLNLISIQRFVLHLNGIYDFQSWVWRQEFNRDYRRKSSLRPIHVDIVCAALEQARRLRR